MKYGKVLWLIGIVVAMAGQSVQAAVLKPNSLIYSYMTNNRLNSTDFFGVAGKPHGGRFGAEFAGPTVVESFSILQDTAYCIKDLDVYADGQFIGTVTMTNTGYNVTQTVHFADFNDGNGKPMQIEATWVTLVVTSSHATNPGAWWKNITFYGDPATTTQVNLNKGIANSNISVTGPIASGYMGVLNRVVDGNLTNTSNASGSLGDAIAWVANPGNTDDCSLTIRYNSVQETIGSVGIALGGTSEAYYAPKWVTIRGETAAGDIVSANITLNADLILYNRYDLPEGFDNIVGLTIAFPLTSDTDQWYTSFDSTFNPETSTFRFALAQFQAFGDTIAPRIPEPATMSLLVLGGLALLRRRNGGK